MRFAWVASLLVIAGVAALVTWQRGLRHTPEIDVNALSSELSNLAARGDYDEVRAITSRVLASTSGRPGSAFTRAVAMAARAAAAEEAKDLFSAEQDFRRLLNHLDEANPEPDRKQIAVILNCIQSTGFFFARIRDRESEAAAFSLLLKYLQRTRGIADDAERRLLGRHKVVALMHLAAAAVTQARRDLAADYVEKADAALGDLEAFIRRRELLTLRCDLRELQAQLAIGNDLAHSLALYHENICDLAELGDRTKLGACHISLGKALAGRAMRASEAIVQFEKGIDCLRDTRDPHVLKQLATGQALLARQLVRSGRQREAVDLYKESIKSFELALGRESEACLLATLAPQAELADLAVSLGMTEVARERFDTVVRALRMLALENPHYTEQLAIVLMARARWSTELDQDTEALQTAKESVKLARRAHSQVPSQRSSFTLAKALLVFSSAQMKAQEFSAAIEAASESVKIRRSLFGENSLQACTANHALGKAMLLAGKLENGKVILQRTWQLCSRTQELRALLPTIALDFSLVLEKQEDYGEASVVLNTSLDMQKATGNLFRSGALTEKLLCALARVQWRQGRPKEARETLQKAVAAESGRLESSLRGLRERETRSVLAGTDVNAHVMSFLSSDSPLIDYVLRRRTLYRRYRPRGRRKGKRRTGMAGQSNGTLVRHLQRALERDCVLVQIEKFVSYRTSTNEVRYSAIVLTKSNVVVVDLGSAATIEPKIRAWMSALQNNKSGIELCRQIASEVWKPIEDAAEPSKFKKVFVVNDGEFHSFPWSAIEATAGSFLVERSVVHVLPTAEELLAKANQHDWDQIVLAGGFDFGKSVDGTVRKWQELPGSTSEVLAIRRLLGNRTRARLIRSIRAGALKMALASADLIHIATHTTSKRTSFSLDRDPFERYGLVLSDANGKADGCVLWGSDVADLPLAGVELLVLSACSSGTGDRQIGVGSFALQDAFLMAGVKRTVGTVWPVDDQLSAQFMTRFYQHLLVEKRDALTALVLTQREYVRRVESPSREKERGPFPKRIGRIAEKTRRLGAIRHWAAYQYSGVIDRVPSQGRRRVSN